MKKTILTLSLVLILLVSCATKKPVETESVPEQVQPVVTFQLPETTEPEPVVPVDVDPVVVPQEAEEETQIIVEPVDAEVEIIVEPAVEEVESESVEEEQQTLSENDWGFVFTSPEHVEEESEAEKTPIIETEPEPVAETTAAITVNPVVDQPVAKQGEMSVFDKVISFISHEILFSFGVLVCVIGLVYFIIALIRSSEPSRRRRTERKEKASEKPDDKDEVPQDTELSDEDDEFLKALLGEGKR